MFSYKPRHFDNPHFVMNKSIKKLFSLFRKHIKYYLNVIADLKIFKMILFLILFKNFFSYFCTYLWHFETRSHFYKTLKKRKIINDSNNILYAVLLKNNANNNNDNDSKKLAKSQFQC